ncbi:MAG: adenylosuccinate synthase [Candidatus Gastranaerophilales bacterium]|nr:adenylosuccinate synthase [Candidatus Gastranaerophilales bacterium]
MKNTVVIGAQFGDEGKAKITDILAKKADFIIRYQGGCNAGHTVVANDTKYKFHLVPSGVLYENKTCFIGAGVVIYPENFKTETDELKSQGVDLKNKLKISPLCHITMPWHIDTDGISETNLGKNKIGTTKKGIGPTYADKYSRCGIRVEDLFDDSALDIKLDIILPLKNKQLKEIYGLKTYSKEDILEKLKTYKELLAPYVCFNWQEILSNAKKNKTVLFEGAQGVMLDVDYGTYPFVTSSNPISGGAAVGGGMGVLAIDEVIGVFKAYMTRVGEGPFITELLDETGAKIQEIGAEFGVTTGRKRRCGWFDGVIAKYSILTGGISSIALTKLDVFDTFDEINFCTGYKNKITGEISDTYPTNVVKHYDFIPVYKSFKGWKTDISKIKTYENLPQNAKIYLSFLEEYLETPIKIISVGADREQTIFKS